jgi:Ca2+-transporting ATPase
MSPTSAAWHSLSVAETLKLLGTNRKTGLSANEARKRLQKNGPNALTRSAGVSPWTILLAQLKNVLILILIVGTALSAVLGHGVEAIAIGVIVAFAVLLGFLQEFRAEKAMDALRSMAAPKATVLRGGKEWKIDAAEIVPGDLILLETGDRVPADARLIEAVNLEADEGALTGESVPVEKGTDAVRKKEAAVGDRTDMVFAGTALTYGRGQAVVTATGMKTEFGAIAALLEGVKTETTPLQKNLDRVGKTLAKAALVIVLLIGGAGWYRGEPLVDILIFAIALAVAVVPEALPAVVTISLAIGVQRMVRRHALIRRLPAVETLGGVTVICTDKTGTLTRNEMTVRSAYVDGRMIEVTGSGYAPTGTFRESGKETVPGEGLLELLRGATLSSDARLVEEKGSYGIHGDPTEGAFVVAAAKAGLRKSDLEKRFPRIGEIPFTSESKRMITVHAHAGGTRAYAKGAAEVILDSCTRAWGEKGEKPLTKKDKEKILLVAKAMSAKALRVLAVARRTGATLESGHNDMKFLGLVGMIDPPRTEAKEAIKTCKAAGIRVVMITGDHPVTAEAIARELGLLTDEKVVTGADVESWTDAELRKRASMIGVYARVSPAHKLRVVTALQAKGHIVAMTGDGVNDAPALKKADIGVAMGITGTDVSKEAAAMTLLDDNFASIVAAVEEGRGIFSNIKKYLMYLLSSNIGEIGLMTGATLLGWPLPLSAVQILYVNLATDGLPALALAVDPPEGDLMRRPPRNPKTGIFTRQVVLLLLTGGLWSTVVTLSLFWHARASGRGPEEAMTMVFMALVLIEFCKAYLFRSERHSIFRKPFANKWLNISILAEIVSLLLIIYVPFLQVPFKTFALTSQDWLIVILAAVTIIPVVEIAKFVERQKEVA